MKNFICLIIIALITISCTRSDRVQVPVEKKFLGLIPQDQFRPRAYREQIFDHTPTRDTSYGAGFQDGCQTSNSAIGDGLYRTAGPKIDGDRLTSDAWYVRGFQDGATYCTFNLDWEPH